jgi:hypothetical protein
VHISPRDLIEEHDEYGWWQKQLQRADFEASLSGECEHKVYSVTPALAPSKGGVYCVVCGKELTCEEVGKGSVAYEFAKGGKYNPTPPSREA